MLAWALRGAAGLLCLIVAGTIAQYTLAFGDDERHPPAGRLVDVGGRKLHLHCEGRGGPAVVFESGWGDSNTTWSDVRKRVADGGQRACSYDRAGYAWSESRSGPRTARAEADDLVALLAAAGERGPYVLVGHSWGGHVLRLLRHHRADLVAGMLLLDVADERDAKAGSAARIQAIASRALATAGLFRTGSWMVDDREPRATRDHAAVVYGPATWRAAAAEMSAYGRTAALLKALPDSPGAWGDLPLSVVSVRTQASMIDHHRRLARLSTNSSHTVAPTDDHYLHLAVPDLVVEHVRRVSDARHRTPLGPRQRLQDP